MSSATITSKGQITIPVSVRADLHVGAGDRIEFIKIAEGRYEVLAATSDISSVKGMVKTDKTVSLQEMDETVKKRAGLLK